MKNIIIDEIQYMGQTADQTPLNRELVSWKSFGNNSESSTEKLREEIRKRR